MRFYFRKRRQPPAVIIVALIDILIVLLIFLMVTTTFKQQPALRLALPESTQAQKTGATEAPPLVVAIDAKGDLRFGPQARRVTVDDFRTQLAEEVAKNPEIKLAISADKSGPIGQLVRVMDASKEAGIKSRAVIMYTKEPGKP